MENRQIDSVTASMEIMGELNDNVSIAVPLQNLFDECMAYISVSDLMV